ncbi:MAG: hypothetical protein SFU86_03765 [Pirellulaceae bacterium]|nr:hypothetical protein [Pirellulaceae bacterium]
MSPRPASIGSPPFCRLSGSRLGRGPFNRQVRHTNVAKKRRLRLHRASRGLELLVRHTPASEKEIAMKKLLLVVTLATLAVSQSGCSSCRQGGLFSGWFNRGGDCNPQPVGCAPGVPQATMMVPSSSPQILPGPIEIAPTN